jgi:hypothetical protein
MEGAMPDPKVGEMILYDYIRPPLVGGEYRLRVDTNVTISNADRPLDGQDFFFNVEGPRFSLGPNEVAGVFPPRNGHGPFESALPHLALGRRTLPWERPLGDAYTVAPGQTPYPFMALVLFDSSECEIKRNMALADVVPPAVFHRLGRPAGIRCDAVEADEQLLRNILPMPEELQLLTHVRRVNVDDRELAAGDSDGYFAVVMGNRIPRSGATYMACLVSVEERTDLLPTTDVVTVGGLDVFVNPELVQPALASALSPSSLGTSITAADADRLVRVDHDAVVAKNFLGNVSLPTKAADEDDEPKRLRDFALPADALVKKAQQHVDINSTFLHPKARLVLLHSWTFTCEGNGTFREIVQRVDVGMIGDVDPASKLAVTDTGHIQIGVIDRLGAPEQSWYRGPLVSQPLTRDPLGPYHSADQARRVVAETGAENISYASAFEVGRLLAAADARLAQELMRWRRGAFRSSSRQTNIDLLRVAMRLTAITDPLDPVALRYSVNVLTKIANGAGPLVDPHGIEVALRSPLLQPAVVARAFGLETPEAAARLLGGIDPLLTQPILVGELAAALVSLEAVLEDTVGIEALRGERRRAIDSATITIRGGGA